MCKNFQNLHAPLCAYLGNFLGKKIRAENMVDSTTRDNLCIIYKIILD
jgi:hypothetical protein